MRVGHRAEFARVTPKPELGHTRYHFQRVSLNGLDAGAELGDRDVASGSLITSYTFDPTRPAVAVLRGSYSDCVTAGAAPRRNSTGLTALTGFDFVASRLFRYRVLVGYAQRSYDSYACPTITAPVAEDSITWTPAQVTTVTATLSHRLEDAIDASVVGYAYTESELVLDHELRRDVVVQVRGQMHVADYEQNDGAQTIYTATDRVD